MVHFMAFSKTGSINRCLGLDVLAPAPGGFPRLLAWLSLRLKITYPSMCLAFIFLYLICSLSVLRLPLSMCLLDSFRTFGCRVGEEDEAEEEEEDEAGIVEVNPEMRKFAPGGPY